MQTCNHTNLAPVANLDGKRALIVDDNATNRKILQHYLQHLGVVAGEVDNAPAALVELEAAVKRGAAYDILLSDLHMPDMDGLALARAIAKNPAIAATPRLLLSSGGMGAEVDRLAMGFVQSLLKPVRQSQLFEAIANALQAPVQKVVDNTNPVEGLPDYHLKRILVAEDNKVNQKVILAMLGKFQNKPDLAENGQEALDLIQHQCYDLILMDCQMPVLDGYEAVRILRGQELAGNGTRIPVVALTAHAAVGEREKCLSAGMDDFLSKPISRPELAKTLAHWLGEPILSSGIQNPKEDMKDATAENACWDEKLALSRLDDDLELLNEMIDLFLTEVPARLLDLEEALANADCAAIADAAHAIKGMAGHFSADQLKISAASLEDSARLGHSVDFLQMTKNVENSATTLISVLKQKQGESL